jgi:hypothetical protein
MAEHFSERELGEFLKTLQSAALKGYPNPERAGCPGSDVLRDVARTLAPFTHPAYEHIKTCSPCLREMLHFQGNAIQDQRARASKVRMRGVLVGCASLVLVVAVILFFLAGRNGGRAKEQTAVEVTRSRQPPLTQELPIIALDFRSVALQRGADDASKQSVQHATRKLAALKVTLPFGSDDGTYSIEIRDPQNGSVLKGASGTAKLLDGETLLTIPRVDLSDVPPGQYDFLFRHADAFWRKGKVSVE